MATNVVAIIQLTRWNLVEAHLTSVVITTQHLLHAQQSLCMAHLHGW